MGPTSPTPVHIIPEVPAPTLPAQAVPTSPLAVPVQEVAPTAATAQVPQVAIPAVPTSAPVPSTAAAAQATPPTIHHVQHYAMSEGAGDGMSTVESVVMEGGGSISQLTAAYQ